MKTTKRNRSSDFTVVQENGVFVARCTNFDVSIEGATEEEAIENLQEALALFFEDLPGPADG